MDAIAITDHGAMYGVVEFYNECRKTGIKPILGMEAYMAPGDRRERSTPGGNAGEAAFHLLLLAQNIEGYKNLLPGIELLQPHAHRAFDLLVDHVENGAPLPPDQCVPRGGAIAGSPAQAGRCADLLAP